MLAMDNFLTACVLSIHFWFANGQLQWQRLFSDVTGKAFAPESRKSASVGYDSNRKFLVVFGGIGAFDRALADTWVYDVAGSKMKNIILQDWLRAVDDLVE